MRKACVLLVPLVLAGCSPGEAPPADAPPPVALARDTLDVRGVSSATAEIAPTGTARVRGTARLAAVDGGTRVTLTLAGLRPGARHAVQVLHGRTCDADASAHLGAAEGHAHGPMLATPPDRHAGDLGGLRADGDGRARYDRVDPHLRLDGTSSAVGRALVVRDGPDDGVTTPDAGAQAVVGCGILEAAP